MRTVEPTKVCARCKERKPWSQFNAKAKWPDGTMRQPHSQCRACRREHSQQWHRRKRLADPEWAQARRQRAYRSLRADPERWAATLARSRQWSREHYGYRVIKSRYDRPTHHRGGGAGLDPRPFAAWLATLGRSAEAISHVVGLEAAQVRKYLNGERQTVTLDVVDRALLNANTLTTLDDLYPLPSNPMEGSLV